MHPIMILTNAAFGPAGRHRLAGVLTAAVLLAVPAVAVALLLPGSFAAAPTAEDLNLAAASTPTSSSAEGGVPVEQPDDRAEVRLKDWSYSAKPISPGVITKK